jgi:VanZ family protein
VGVVPPVVAFLRWIPAIAWMMWIFWLSSQEALPPPPGLSYSLAAIAGHFLLYAALTFLVLFAVGSWRRLRPGHVWLALLIVFTYAISDEAHQSFVPQREASGFDILVDMIGAVTAASIWTIGWRRIATQ